MITSSPSASVPPSTVTLGCHSRRVRTVVARRRVGDDAVAHQGEHGDCGERQQEPRTHESTLQPSPVEPEGGLRGNFAVEAAALACKDQAEHIAG
jgi:hypothetical protein